MCEECAHKYATVMLAPHIYVWISLHLIPTLRGIDVPWHTPPCSTVVHVFPRQSLLCDIIHHSVQPSSVRPSSFLPPCTFIVIALYIRSVLLFLSHAHTTRKPNFLDFLCRFPHFRCSSYSFISYLVQLRNSAYPS